MGETVYIGDEAVGRPSETQPMRSTSRRTTRPSGSQAGPSERQAEPSRNPSSGTGFFRGWPFRRSKNRRSKNR